MLTDHLREAISINIARKKIYMRLTSGKSRALSNQLIFFERMLILPAVFLDRRAKRFNEQRIPIMQNDFVSMDQLPKPEATPNFKNVLPENAFIKLIKIINVFNTRLKQEIKQAKIGIILIEGKKLLEKIKEFEHEYQCHLAMLKHVTESLNLIASNGIVYAEKSEGRTLSITKAMIKGHGFLLKPSLKRIDLPAQQFHTLSCGIIVNDLPEILLPGI